MTPATHDRREARRSLILVAAAALAGLALLAGLTVRNADEHNPAAPATTTTSSPARWRHHPTTMTTTPNALDQPAGVVGDILRAGAGAACTALHC